MAFSYSINKGKRGDSRSEAAEHFSSWGGGEGGLVT